MKLMLADQSSFLWMPAAARGLLIALVLSVCACERQVPIEEALQRPPLVEPLQLTMGKYYSRAVNAYEHFYYPTDDRTVSWKFPIGPQSVSMFDRVFASMFMKTLPIDRLPTAAGDRSDVAAVIETKIEQFRVQYRQSRHTITNTRIFVEITYRFIVYMANGETIASWTVTGTSLYAPRTDLAVQVLPEPKWMSAAVKLAMRDAAGKFVAGFPEQPRIKNWLHRIGAASGGPQ